MKAAEDAGQRTARKTPRKTSVDSSYKRKFTDKLRSNSSFKKKSRNEEASPSPLPYRDSSTSRPPVKSVGKLDRAKSKQELQFIPLCRKNTKNSDIVHPTKGDADSDCDLEFFSLMTKSQRVKSGVAPFDSKGTSNLSKSITVGQPYPRTTPCSTSRRSSPRRRLSTPSWSGAT